MERSAHFGTRSSLFDGIVLLFLVGGAFDQLVLFGRSCGGGSESTAIDSGGARRNSIRRIVELGGCELDRCI